MSHLRATKRNLSRAARQLSDAPTSGAKLAPLLPTLHEAALEAIFTLRAAQACLTRSRGRGVSVTAEQLERCAANLYQALDRATGAPAWVTCPDCGETVRTLEAHRVGCLKGRSAEEWE